MLVPVRHIARYQELFDEEKKELEMIKSELDYENHFDAMFENFTAGRTFLDHFHIHLLKWKRI